MIDTKVKTKTVTNTQIAVATMAMFMAGGLAFAAAPAKNRAAAPKCGVNKSTVVSVIQGCARGQYSGINYTCHDGTKVQHRPGVCMTPAQLNAVARVACANKCSSAPAPVAQQATLSLEIVSQSSPLFRLTNTTSSITGTELQIKTGDKPVRLESFGLAFTNYNELHNVASSIHAIKLYEPGNYTPEGLKAAKVLGFENALHPSITIALDQPLIIPANTTLTWVIALDIKPLPEANPGSSFRIALDDRAVAHRAIDNVTAGPARVSIGNGQGTMLTILPGTLGIIPEVIPENQNLIPGQVHIPGFTLGHASYEPIDRQLTMNLLTTKIDLRIEGIASSSIQNIELCTLEEFCIPLELWPSGNDGVYPLINRGSGNTNIDLTAFADETAKTLAVGENVTYYVRATVPEVGENALMQLNMREVNATGITYDFDFLGEEHFHQFVASGIKSMNGGDEQTVLQGQPLIRF